MDHRFIGAVFFVAGVVLCIAFAYIAGQHDACARMRGALKITQRSEAMLVLEDSGICSPNDF